MAILLSFERLATYVALDEVRKLPVWELHELPRPFNLHFLDERNNEVVWTTDRDYHAMNPGVLSPKQYAPLAAAKIEMVGELERRLGLRLVAVELVFKEER